MKLREKIAWGIVGVFLFSLLVAVTTDDTDFTLRVKPRPIHIVAGMVFQEVPGQDRWVRIE